MICIHHADTEAFANCTRCQRPFCNACLVQMEGAYYCFACKDVRTPDAAFQTTSTAGGSPGLAFGLGFIPGVGAIYNGEYLKAVVQVMIFGFLISIADAPGLGKFGAMFGMLVGTYYFYMPLEAYHTARRRRLEASGHMVARSKESLQEESLWSGIVLTALGSLFFVNNFVEGFIERLLRFWPVMLIAAGLYLVARHLRAENLVGDKP
ncbi:MAG: DUF5668 domain-containing protein [Acidobacteriota bacterium]